MSIPTVAVSDSRQLWQPLRHSAITLDN